MIKNLQRAINDKFHERLLLDKTQWFSDKQNRAVTVYKLKKELPEEEQRVNRKYMELFSTYSEIQVVLFLRDYWYKLNGWKVPTDNELWEDAKKKYYAEKEIK